MNTTEKRLKAAQMYDSLHKLHHENREGMSPAQAREFSKISDELDSLHAEIRWDKLQDRREHLAELDQMEEELTPALRGLHKQCAKRVLFDATKSLFSGERRKIDQGYISELSVKYGLPETRTEYPSTNIVSTTYGSVFMELVADSDFLRLIPSDNVRDGYLKIPLVTRENAPTAEGKESSGAMVGTDTNFTSVTLEPKNFYCLNQYHKDLFRDGGQRAMDAVWTSTRDAVTKRLVSTIFSGSTANAGEFNGFDNISGAQEYDVSGSSISDYSLLTRGTRLLNTKFVSTQEIVTIMHPITYGQYSDLRELSSSGAYLMPPTQISTIPLLTNPAIKTNYTSNRTRLYMMRPQSAFLALFGSFEMDLQERYAELDHAAALAVFRADFCFKDPDHLFIGKGLPT